MLTLQIFLRMMVCYSFVVAAEFAVLWVAVKVIQKLRD